jgi:hypothetical protein
VIAALAKDQQVTNEIAPVVADEAADTSNELHSYLEDYYAVEIMNQENYNMRKAIMRKRAHKKDRHKLLPVLPRKYIRRNAHKKDILQLPPKNYRRIGFGPGR